jgi:hypothetical protein
MPHPELMRWSNFLQIEPNSRLVRHNRLFSNWFRVQLKLSQSGESVLVHRIGAKRIVVEVRNSQPSARVRLAGRKFGKWAAVVLLSALIAFAVGISLLGAPNTETKTRFATGNHIDASRTQQCLDLTHRDPFEIHDLADFEIEGWAIKTYGLEISLGALQSISFEAQCKNDLVIGTLLHSKVESGHLILRMTPIKRPGS